MSLWSLVLVDSFIPLVLNDRKINKITFKDDLISVTVKMLVSILHCNTNIL